VASDGDSQAVHLVKPKVLHGSSLSIGKYDSLADKLSLGSLELAKDTDARTFTIGMGDPDSEVELVGLLHLKGAQVVTGPRQTSVRWNSARHDRAHDRAQIALYVWIHPDEDRSGQGAFGSIGKMGGRSECQERESRATTIGLLRKHWQRR
jgi:hypothetical protein